MVLFLKYQDMMADQVNHVRKLGEFMGCPFFENEERDEVVEGSIVKLCNFDNLSNLEVNKNNDLSSEEMKIFMVPSSVYFWKRKGRGLGESYDHGDSGGVGFHY